MSDLYKAASKFGGAPRLLKMAAPAMNSVQSRNLNMLEYQSKGLLLDYVVTVQKFRMATNDEEAAKLQTSPVRNM